MGAGPGGTKGALSFVGGPSSLGGWKRRVWAQGCTWGSVSRAPGREAMR